MVPSREIIGIFDLDNTTSSHITRKYLTLAEKSGRVITIGDDIPKSFILRMDRNKLVTVYLSQLAPATLMKRAEADIFDI